MQKRIEDLFKLFSLWQQYVDIIYMPEAEIGMMKALKDNGLYNSDGQDLSFAQKMENENIDQKLATLFAPDDEEALEKDLEQASSTQNLDEAYLSAQEGLTTDTALSAREGEEDS